MSGKYAYCSTVPRTFVQDCRFPNNSFYVSSQVNMQDRFGQVMIQNLRVCIMSVRTVWDALDDNYDTFSLDSCALQLGMATYPVLPVRYLQIS